MRLEVYKGPLYEHTRSLTQAARYNFKDGMWLRKADGYIGLNRDIHNGQDLEHRRIAEKALGHPLPAKAIVHHVDGNRANNAPSNLVICENQAYHLLLHVRARALTRKKKLPTD